MNEKTFFIGMDLGTFKTSVTASNGRRESLHTAVGWPRDHVARAMLGRDVVFGEEVMQNRLALNVVRPFAKGALKYVGQSEAGISDESIAQSKDAARKLVEHVVALMQPPAGASIFGVVGAPSRATIENKQVLIDTVRNAFDAVVIVAEPFAVAYSMNRLVDTLVVDIGAGTIDICPVYGAYPKVEDQVTLPMGGDTVDEDFYNRLRNLHPEARVSLNMAREIKEKYGFVHDVDESARVMLPVDGRPTEFDVTSALKESCKAIVDPIVEGVREVISRFDPEFQRPLLNNIVIGGGGSGLKGLDLLVEEGLKACGGGNVTKVQDSVFAGAAGALKLAMSMPAECWEQLRVRDDDASSQRLQRAAA